MKSKLLSIIALALLPLCLKAQDLSVSGFGLDPSDEAAVKEINARMDSIRRHRPTVALVLGGGGARGAAHVGVLKYIEERGLPIDLVVGTSMGGLVGGLYSMGYSPTQLDSLLRSIDWEWLLSDDLGRRYVPKQRMRYQETFALTIPFGKIGDAIPSGVVRGQNVTNLFAGMSAGFADSTDFLRFPVPFACVSTELVSGRAKVWHSGSIVTALRSTMSIPALFTPVKKDGMVLADGGMRNNYPSVIAKQMGADLVIGVDLSEEAKDFDDVNNLVDVVTQMVLMMSREAYQRGIEAADINIKPDLPVPQYGMLSFSGPAIDSIIRRGYRASAGRMAEIDAIVQKTGKASYRTGGRHATDVGTTPVRIKDVEFEGISAEEARLLRRKVKLPGDMKVDRNKLEEQVATLYGTGAFNTVEYSLLGTGEPYTLLLKGDKGYPNRFGLGVRYDSEELVSAIINLGLGTRRISGHSLDMTAKIGLNSYGALEYKYKPAAGLVLGVKSYLHMTDRSKLMHEDMDIAIHMLQARQEISLSGFGTGKFDLQTGLRHNFFRIRDLLYYSPESPNSSYLSAFVRAGYDGLDSGYFPKKGWKADAQYEAWLPIGSDEKALFHVASGSFSAAVTAGRVTFAPSVWMRFVLSGSEEPAPLYNLVGGMMRGRYLEQQVPFAGISNAIITPPLLGIAGFTVRWEPFDRHFVSLMGNVGDSSFSFSGMAQKDALFAGAALQYAYYFPFGPIKADMHWSTVNQKFGVYLSVGYDF